MRSDVGGQLAPPPPDPPGRPLVIEDIDGKPTMGATGRPRTRKAPIALGAPASSRLMWALAHV